MRARGKEGAVAHRHCERRRAVYGDDCSVISLNTHHASGMTGNPRAALNVTSAYDAFLFAPMDNGPERMPLSVLSAFARMNFDPWEEAAHLAALPTPEAERILASMLDLLPGRGECSPETRVLAARLVALLPKGRATTAKGAAITADRKMRIREWLVMLFIAVSIAAALLSPHQHATAAGAGDSASPSNAAPPTEDRGAAIRPDH
ncbi:MAG: hypothetical protein WA190_02365 [Usitatibacter sp.]